MFQEKYNTRTTLSLCGADLMRVVALLTISKRAKAKSNIDRLEFHCKKDSSITVRYICSAQSRPDTSLQDQLHKTNGQKLLRPRTHP